MTLTEFIEGFKAGKYGLVYEGSQGFYDFCDRLEPLLCLDHEIAWYANRGINSIGEFAEYYCVNESRMERFSVLFMNTEIKDLDCWSTENKDAIIQNGEVKISRNRVFSFVYWHDIDNNCANFEELL